MDYCRRTKLGSTTVSSQRAHRRRAPSMLFEAAPYAISFHYSEHSIRPCAVGLTIYDGQCQLRFKASSRGPHSSKPSKLGRCCRKKIRGCAPTLFGRKQKCRRKRSKRRRLWPYSRTVPPPPPPLLQTFSGFICLGFAQLKLSVRMSRVAHAVSVCMRSRTHAESCMRMLQPLRSLAMHAQFKVVDSRSVLGTGWGLQ